MIARVFWMVTYHYRYTVFKGLQFVACCYAVARVF